MDDQFEIIGEITQVETIATNANIREIENLRKLFEQRPLAKAKRNGDNPIEEWPLMAC